jgi:hypothetical protein
MFTECENVSEIVSTHDPPVTAVTVTVELTTLAVAIPEHPIVVKVPVKPGSVTVTGSTCPTDVKANAVGVALSGVDVGLGEGAALGTIVGLVDGAALGDVVGLGDAVKVEPETTSMKNVSARSI